MSGRDQVPVLIVGGGPVGLAAAMLLAQRGIEVLLVERRRSRLALSRAHLLNVRTMEIFHEMGVADDIYAQAPATTTGGGRSSGTPRSPAPPRCTASSSARCRPGAADGRAAVRRGQPAKFTNLPQIRLDPLLWAHADAAAPAGSGPARS